MPPYWWHFTLNRCMFDYLKMIKYVTYTLEVFLKLKSRLFGKYKLPLCVLQFFHILNLKKVLLWGAFMIISH